MEGIKGLLQSKKGMTGLLALAMNLLVAGGFTWANKPDLIVPLVSVITTLGSVLIGGYALQDFGKEAARIKQSQNTDEPGPGEVLIKE